ncbi:MAG: formate dehydrogenase accessory protein FdhE [Reyranella sp.]|uniref:formate dehydrogenase accessory protein FdhE n=1 Tax=Reyranella sp. TaxID=1929291 RepID=UPI003D0ECB53
MVPPGSRQTLSQASVPPGPGLGESTLGDVVESERVLLPDLATVFARRAARLTALAPGHEVEGFLRLVASLVSAQHAALADLPAGRLPGGAEIAEARRTGRAPLDPAVWKRDASWQAALTSILGRLDRSLLPAAGQAACEALAAAGHGKREVLADRFLGGDIAHMDSAKMPFVVAALQVAWTRMAALMDTGELAPAESRDCPVCGSPPVAGVIAPGGTKFGHRHLHCSLCATAWRHVRVRCVNCGSTDKISYRQLAGTSFLRAECCEACHGYSKVFYLESARVVEPLADDLGSLGLDVLVGEEGFSRVANPFVIASS